MDVTATLTPIPQAVMDAAQTIADNGAADIAALAALAVVWGLLVSLIITIADMRKPMETWRKAAWALGLCFAPFILYSVIEVATVGIHSYLTSISQAVQRGMEAAGGTFMGHSGQNLAQKQQAGTAITTDDVVAATTTPTLPTAIASVEVPPTSGGAD